MSSVRELDYGSIEPVTPPREPLTAVPPRRFENSSSQPCSKRHIEQCKSTSSKTDHVLPFDVSLNSPDSDSVTADTVHSNTDPLPDCVYEQRLVAEKGKDPNEKTLRLLPRNRAVMAGIQQTNVASLAFVLENTSCSPPLSCPRFKDQNNMIHDEPDNSENNRATMMNSAGKGNNGLSITTSRQEFVRPSPKTALPAFMSPISQRKNSLPSSLAAGPNYLRSLLRDYHVHDTSASHTLLPPIQSPNSSPTREGPASPQTPIKLASIESIFQIANTSQKNIDRQIQRQRQNSLNALSSIASASPVSTGVISPSSSHFDQSPSTGLTATSPREWIHNLPSSTATSPSFGGPSAQSSRLRSATEPFPHYSHAHLSSGRHSMRLDATDLAYHNKTPIITPGPIFARTSRESWSPITPAQPVSPTYVGPPQYSPTSDARSLNSADIEHHDGSLPKGSLSANTDSEQDSPTRSSQIQGSGTYKCDHPGCDAQPFHTQYLLK